MVIDLTKEKLEQTIVDFFKDYFDEMWFMLDKTYPILHFKGFKGRVQGEYAFDLCKWDSHFKMGIEHHMLENMKGDWVRSEKQMFLEKRKAAN